MLDQDDFDNTPLLQGRGGAANAKKLFGKPNSLIARLNEAVAALTPLTTYVTRKITSQKTAEQKRVK